MSAVQVLDAPPKQVHVISVRDAFLDVTPFLYLAPDNDDMIFGSTTRDLPLSNSPKATMRNYDDVIASMRAHLELSFEGRADAATHKEQFDEELKALKTRVDRKRAVQEIPPVYTMDV